MSETVSIKIRIDDSGTFKNVTVDAEDLNKAIKHVTKQANDFNKSLVNWSQAASASESLNSVIGNLRNTFADLASGFNDDKVGLAKLTQAMRNTMGASDDMVASVEGLIDAQERLGVIEKDAQLAGAQELATYLELGDSLKTLIPVMNDMAAQQIGIGASGESVAQIASMLGKVMEGQTEALSRYGYKFDEVQKHILQFGSESERAAVLAEVVTSSVGGMNEALRNTDAGRMFEAKVAIDGVKDALGSIVVKIMPVLDGFAELGQATTGIFELHSSIKAVWEAMDGMKIKTIALATHQKVQAAAQRILAASGYTAAAGTTALRIATAALYATMTAGIYLIIQGLIELFTRLANKANDAAGEIDEVDEATQAFRRTSSDARSALTMEVVALEDMIRKKKDAKDKVAELNSKYGESFGYYNTAAEWYDVLKAKSQAYCTQIGYEAQARSIASQKAAKEIELQAVGDEKARMLASGQNTEKGLVPSAVLPNGMTFWTIGDKPTDEFLELVDKEKALTEETASLESQFSTCIQNMANAQAELAASTEGTVQSVSWEKMSLTDLSKAIQNQEEKVKGLVGANNEQARSENELLIKMKAREKLLKQSVGMESGNGSSYSTLALDIEKYQLSVERAVQVNQSFKTEISDEVARLEAMKSGITSLISKYGSESDAIQKLIDDYYALRKAIGERGGMIDVPLPKLEFKGLPEGYKPENEPVDPGLAQKKEDDKDDTDVNKIDAATESLSALSDVMQSLSDIVGEGAAAWMSWGANVLSAIGQAIPAIAALIAARKAEATVNTEAAATGAAASQASIPYVGPILAVAAVASVLAAVANLPKFAKGGIAYGPTLGLFGEYAGASNNPEVVAPLDKLKSLIGGSAMLEDGVVEFRMDGRYLSGVLRRVQKINRRSKI